MKIALMGGWGYGNLGDTIILNETLRDLADIYPDAEFLIMSYGTEDVETSSVYRFCNSLHSKIDFGSSRYRFQKIGKQMGDVEKICSKLKMRICETNIVSMVLCKYNEPWLRDLLGNVDFLIMCGGGYFNERWQSQVNSVLYTLITAQKNNIKTIIYGPTIGKFDRIQKDRVASVLLGINKVAVRDHESKKRLSELGIDSTLISDAAISNRVCQ